MSGKVKTMYRCTECGYTSPKWLGRCPECRTWDAMIEQSPQKATKSAKAAGAVRLADVAPAENGRLATGVAELDRVLGGGVVPGSVVLLAGEPGIGKSTLILQAAAGLQAGGRKLLYVSGEESPAQIRLRAQRLNLDLGALEVVAETSLEPILATAAAEDWDVMAVDSIQSVQCAGPAAAPGTLAQIREAASRLIAVAKAADRSVWLVGHVTKEGSIAGPKVLEHMVDAVLHFEGERSHNLRLLRSYKNRYGSTNEIGVFEMKDSGLVEVENPSALFLAERPIHAAGSVVVPTMEGTRPILVELQALVSQSGLAMPRRQALGIDAARLSLLTAVLEKKVGLRLYDRDVFVNVTGGVRVVEPAADLGLVAAVASSYHDRPAPAEAVFVGEIGLTGEVRGVSRLDVRLREAAKLGFSRAVLPKSEARRLKSPNGMQVEGVGTVADLLELLG